MVKNGRALEAATYGAQQIKQEAPDSKVSRIKKPGRYSRKGKKNQEPTLAPDKTSKDAVRKCNTCSSKSCKGGKKCPAAERECFDCHEEGHFRGAPCCKGKKVSKKSNRVQHSESTSSEYEGNTTSDETESESEASDMVKRTRRLVKCVTTIRRMRLKTKKVRRTAKAPRYEVEVAINGEITKVFVDTGADISVMSMDQAKALGLKLCKTKMKIRPYGSKPVKCKGRYIGTVMYGDNVVNTCIYIVKQKLETLLSGRVCEELGIIEFNPQPVRRTISDTCPHKTRLAAAYPSVFEDKVGRLRNYTVKLHVDETVKPVAERCRPVAFHLRKGRSKQLGKMEDGGLIEEHHGPAPWISNTVLAPKDDGGMRVTVDM